MLRPWYIRIYAAIHTQVKDQTRLPPAFTLYSTENPNTDPTNGREAKRDAYAIFCCFFVNFSSFLHLLISYFYYFFHFLLTSSFFFRGCALAPLSFLPPAPSLFPCSRYPLSLFPLLYLFPLNSYNIGYCCVCYKNLYKVNVPLGGSIL